MVSTPTLTRVSAAAMVIARGNSAAAISVDPKDSAAMMESPATMKITHIVTMSARPDVSFSLVKH